MTIISSTQAHTGSSLLGEALFIHYFHATLGNVTDVFLLCVCGAFYSKPTVHGKSYTEVNQQRIAQ